MTEVKRKSSPALVAGAWIVVILPALWGLTFTVQNAMKIFVRPPAVSAPAPAVSAPSPAAPAR